MGGETEKGVSIIFAFVSALGRELCRSKILLTNRYNLGTAFTENTKQIDVAEEACKIAEENLDLNTFSYKEGKLPILDVLSAQLSWIQSYSSLIQTWYQQKASLAQYNKAVGIRRLQ